MNFEQSAILIRCSLVVVHNGYRWPKECFSLSMHPPGEVNIFHIHEKAFVKATHFLQYGVAKKLLKEIGCSAFETMF